MTILYGIPNCSTVKKARTWLEESGIDYDFHDYKKRGVDATALDAFITTFGWEKVLNSKGMTWRKLTDEQKAEVVDAASAKALMIEKPSIIKRPLIETGSGHLLGYDEAQYAEIFKS